MTGNIEVAALILTVPVWLNLLPLTQLVSVAKDFINLLERLEENNKL
jgi:hypothetical protein